jgi:hypothetical protein
VRSAPRVELADLRTMRDEIERRSFAFNRIPGPRNSRGRIPESVANVSAPATPLTIITSVPVLQWIRADLGITLATGVSAWADQSGNGHHFTQGTGSSQPLYNASDFTLNGRPSVTGDGVDDMLLNGTMPNGTPNWMSGMAKVINWGALRMLWGSNAAPECTDLYMASSSPNLALYNGNLLTNLNDGLPVGTWGRIETHFINSPACYLKLRNKTISTASAGGLTSTGCALFSSTGSLNANAAFAERIVCGGKPNPGELSLLEAYYVNLYTQANVA